MNFKNINRMIMAGNIRMHTVNLPPGLYGYVYYSKKGRYHIFISDALAPQARQEVLLHEIYHIMVDMPKHTYIFGLDMQWEEIELRANYKSKKLRSYQL